MVTTEREASTLNEYQVANLPQIEHRGYYYFPFQENPQIATQSGVIFLPSEIRGNYLCSFNRDAESATASGFGQKALSFLPDESIFEQIMLLTGRFYTIQNRIETHSFHEFFDTVSTYTPQISASYLQIEQSAINIFDAYQHEGFDTDIAYEFTNALDRLIRANGKPAVRIINDLIKKQILNDDIISETLKALGRIEDENTKYERYELLIGSIKNESAIIRDGAVSGLSFLDEKRALPQLRMLFETETLPILKNNIKVAIRSLEIY
ncbi:unnamed protein product [marine sediment metagenome]|uniref:Uncharacterized protein n=1 Tax=marine sediment metagenome TaxID=412755 RepID=X1H377_9ZZZZ